MNAPTPITKNTARYKNARIALLATFIMAIANLGLVFVDMYFLYSPRIPLDVFLTGLDLADLYPSLAGAYVAGAAVISLVLIAPYILAWIFSKNKPGWMIAALVIFAIDTVYLAVFVPANLEADNFSVLTDLLIHIVALIELAIGVKAGFAMKKEAATAQEQAEQATPESQEEQPLEGVLREITFVREKSFAACAVSINLFANDKLICTLKNKEQKTVSVTAASFTLVAAFSNNFAAQSVNVPAGEDACRIVLKTRMGFSAANIDVKIVQGDAQ